MTEYSAISELHLNTLGSGIPALTAIKAGQRMEACVWCLIECKHSNGVIMAVNDDENNKQYKILWNDHEIDREALHRAYNIDDGPEHGAEAIALLLIRERTDYTAIRRSVRKTGIDYWLGYKTNVDNQIFSRDGARLEISGILRQSAMNRMTSRTRGKTRQTRQSDNTSVFPVYVVVVEFSVPVTQMACRNVGN